MTRHLRGPPGDLHVGQADVDRYGRGQRASGSAFDHAGGDVDRRNGHPGRVERETASGARSHLEDGSAGAGRADDVGASTDRPIPSAR